MLKNFLLIGLGGAAGSMIRYAFALWFKHSSFPLATFLVNIIGCFVIGCVFAVSVRNELFASNWKLFLATGICGGFTTYSAFSMESLQLLQQQRVGLFTIYIAATIIGGLAAICTGYYLLKG
jgi:fluoride exporter